MDRKILIANTKTQKRYQLDSHAETLGQLKAELDAANYDYSGLTFTEGISNTQLLDDNSQLPTNVKHVNRETGEVKTTNDLIIMLMNTKKNIPLGALSSERTELFSFIKEHNLQSQVLAEFHKNMTQVSTAELRNFVYIYGHQDEEAAPETPTEAPQEKSELDSIADDILAQHGFGTSEETKDAHFDENDEYHGITSVGKTLKKAIRTVVDTFAEDDEITKKDIQDIINVLQDELQYFD